MTMPLQAVADEKDAINIHAFTSQINAAKNLDEHSTSKNRDEKLRPEPLKSAKIFTDDWEDSLPNTPQRQILGKLKHGNTFCEENNTTANKKSVVTLNKSLFATLYERSAIIPLNKNKLQDCYTLYLYY